MKNGGPPSIWRCRRSPATAWLGGLTTFLNNGLRSGDVGSEHGELAVVALQEPPLSATFLRVLPEFFGQLAPQGRNLAGYSAGVAAAAKCDRSPRHTTTAAADVMTDQGAGQGIRADMAGDLAKSCSGWGGGRAVNPFRDGVYISYSDPEMAARPFQKPAKSGHIPDALFEASPRPRRSRCYAHRPGR